jgi:single-strand DNA-binding protein
MSEDKTKTPSYNRVQLAGRLVADPEVRQTSTGKTVATLRLATNDTKTPEFHTVVAWEALAESVSDVTKGHLLAIAGRIRTRSYDKDGAKRYVTEIVATDICDVA